MRYLPLLLFTCFTIFSQAQDISFSLGETFRDYNVSKYDYPYPLSVMQPRIVGSTDEHIFTFHVDMKDKGLKVSKFDTTLTKLYSKDLVLPTMSKRMRFFSCVSNQGTMNFILSEDDPSTMERKIFVVQMNENLDIATEPKKVASINYFEKEKLGVSLSDDKSKICFWRRQKNRKKDSVYTEYWVYSAQDNSVLWNRPINFNGISKNVSLLHSKIDNEGNVYAIVRKKRQKSSIKKNESEWMVNIQSITPYGITKKEISMIPPIGKEFCNVVLNTEDEKQVLLIATLQKRGSRKKGSRYNVNHGRNGLMTRVFDKKSFQVVSSKDLLDYPMTDQEKYKEKFYAEKTWKTNDGWIATYQARSVVRSIGDYYQWIKLDKSGRPTLKKQIKLNEKNKNYLNTTILTTPKYTGFVIEGDARNKNKDEKKILSRSDHFQKFKYWNRYLRIITIDNETGELFKKDLYDVPVNTENFFSYYWSEQVNENNIVIPYINRLVKISVY